MNKIQAKTSFKYPIIQFADVRIHLFDRMAQPQNGRGLTPTSNISVHMYGALPISAFSPPITRIATKNTEDYAGV